MQFQIPVCVCMVHLTEFDLTLIRLVFTTISMIYINTA